jgi:hypothetical protein
VNTSGIITTVAGNGTAGYSGDGGPAISAKLFYPDTVTVDSAGNIFIADEGNNRVRKVDTSGIITTVAGNGIAGYSGDNGPSLLASLYSPRAVAVDPAGNLTIADFHNNRIRKVATTSGPCAGLPEGSTCNDNNACTNNDVCSNGACKGTAIVCNDNNACTTDMCYTATGCAYVPVRCPLGYFCDPATGTCVNPDPCAGVICDDNNTCTTDSCNTAIGACVYTPVADGTACTANIQPGTCTAGQCIPYPVCPAGSVKSATIRGGGQRPNSVDLQIQTNFTVVNGGCISGYTESTVTCTPGTNLLVNVKAGKGPMPTSCTWKGAPISTDMQFVVACPAVSGDVGKLICDNKLGGGKDSDKMTISVQ